MKLKKMLKVIIGIVVFITLPSLLLFGFAYYNYNEEIPEGETGIEADALATKMLETLNYKAFKNVNYLEFSSLNRRHYEWEISKNICTIYWKDFKVELNLINQDSSFTYMHSFKVTGEQNRKLLKKAVSYYNKDTFWLLAPFKVFDEGVERKIVNTKEYSNALLVIHPKNHDVPVKTYLWILDKNGKPTSFKMWDSSLPINGLEATWNHWITTENGVLLPNFHKIFLFGFEFRNISEIQ